MPAGSSVNVAGMDRIRGRRDYSSAVHSARRAVYVVLALSLVVFVSIAVIAVLEEGFGNFIETLGSMRWSYYLLALLIIFFSYTMRYPKWSMYLRRLGVKIPTARNYVIYLSMYSMDMTPGRWGRAVVSYTINRLAKVRFAATFPAVVADIFTDFLGFAIITDSMALVVGKFVVLSFLLTVLLMIPFFFVYVRRPFDYVKGKVWKMRRKFKILKKLDIVFKTASLYFKHNRKLRGSAFIYSMLLTVPSMFLNGMALYVVMLAFGVPLALSSVPTVIFIFSSSLVLGIITGIPGTLGITDAAMISQIQYFWPGTIDFGLASAITILFRIASVWFVQGFGFAAFLYTMRYWDA